MRRSSPPARRMARTACLGVLENREKATVKAFFLSMPKHLRDTVRCVCSDLYAGYTEAAREVFGDGVVIVADRFHVVRVVMRHLLGLARQVYPQLAWKLS